MNEVQEPFEELERWQPPGAAAQWSDSFYFGDGDARRRTAFSTRIGRPPNEGRVEAAIGIRLPDGRFALGFARAETAGEAAGGLRYDPLVPGAVWRLGIGGRARVYRRPEDLADPAAALETVALGGELTFTGWVAPFHFSGGLTEQVAARHYEQPGSVSGVLTVGLMQDGVLVAPLRQRRDGRLTRVIPTPPNPTELAWGEHKGLTISEWLVQSDA